MKKLTLVLVSLFIVSTSFAQNNFAFGVKGGLNFNKISTNAGSLSNNYKESLDSKTGFSAGVYSRIGDKFYVQPEILFSQRAGKIEKDGTKYDIKYNSFDVPVLVGVKLINFLRINAGPVLNLKLSESGKIKDDLNKDLFKTSSFGYAAGAGITLGKIEIDVRKDGSLGSISDKAFQDDKFNQRLNGWQISLGLLF